MSTAVVPLAAPARVVRGRRLFIACCVWTMVVPLGTCLAEPPPNDLAHSRDPILVQARSVDERYAPPDTANQEKAVKLYLQYIDAHPKSDLAPLILLEIARNWLPSLEYQKFGARYDKEQALKFYRSAVAAYPKGKIGPTLSHALVSVAAFTPGKAASAMAYLDYLQWLHSLTVEEVVKTLWFTKAQQAMVDSGAWSARKSAEGFMRQVKQMQVVATANMLSLIDGVEDQSEKIVLLQQVASRLPGIDAGKRATASLASLGLKVEPTSRPATRPLDPREWAAPHESPRPSRSGQLPPLDPDLQAAMSYDGTFNGGDLSKCNQALAEKYYLKYLDRCTDTAERARVYSQLGSLFNTNFQLSLGEKADYAKARLYFAQALKEEPDRIGEATLQARGGMASPLQSPEERLRIRIDLYKWLSRLRAATPSDQLLLGHMGHRSRESDLRSLLGLAAAVQASASANMLYEVRRSKNRVQSLQEIVRELPGTKPAAAAQEKLDELAAEPTK